MPRNYVHFCVAIAAALLSSVRADVTYTEPTNAAFPTIQLNVTPAAEPVPALKYHLVPRDIELKPGNIVPYYYRALLDMQSTMKSIRTKFNEDTELSLWYGAGANVT